MSFINDEENPCQRNIRGNHVALCQQGRAGIARIVDSLDATFAGTTVPYEVWLTYPKTGRRFMAAAYMTSEEARRNSLQLRKEWTNDKDGMPNIEIKFKDSIKDDDLSKEEQELVDYVIENFDHHGNADKALRMMNVYYSAYQSLARRKPDEVKEYFNEHVNDSVKDEDAQYNWMVELDRNNIDYVFINGGYGMEFRNQNDYTKAKELAKKVNYTQGHWDDKKLTSFDYRSTRISNELDSVKDSLKAFEIEYKDGNNVVIQLVKAKSLEDAIKKAKVLKK